MNWQPTLDGPRLHLRPIQASDFDALYAVASDPLIWETHPERDRYTRPKFEIFFRGALECGGGLAVVLRADGRLVGSSRFLSLETRAPSDRVPVPAGETAIEIGYSFLARELWGGSYNRELKSLMLTHAFRSVENVEFYVGENNLRSRGAMEKVGGKIVGIVPGKIIYRICRDDSPNLELIS